MNIKDRVEKLEALRPKVVSPLKNLTETELKEEMFLIWQKLYESGFVMGAEHLYALCRMPRLRAFANAEKRHWLHDSNHRMNVFHGFIARTIGRSLPNQERINYIFGLGWRGVEIPPDEIQWMMTESTHLDLGDETPWLLEYMEGSGLSSFNGSTVKIQP